MAEVFWGLSEAIRVVSQFGSGRMSSNSQSGGIVMPQQIWEEKIKGERQTERVSSRMCSDFPASVVLRGFNIQNYT